MHIQNTIQVRLAKPTEYKLIGELMFAVYSNLEGFPKPEEQPEYYNKLLQVGKLTANKNTELIVAVSEKGEIYGAVVFFSDMKYYGSGGTATLQKNAAGFRLLAVNDEARGKGIGKVLTMACIKRAKKLKLNQVIIHTTEAMQTAWGMYERIGFKRSSDLDFMQQQLKVFGFRLLLN